MDSMRRSQLTVVNLKELMHSLGLYLKNGGIGDERFYFLKKKKRNKTDLSNLPIKLKCSLWDKISSVSLMRILGELTYYLPPANYAEIVNRCSDNERNKQTTKKKKFDIEHQQLNHVDFLPP